jgi:predicted aconitase
MIRTKKPISLLDGIDRKTGVIIQKGHDLEGKCLANVELRFPKSTGSTVGICTLLELKENAVAPKKIILSEPDSNVIAGCILAGIPIEVEGIKETKLDKKELAKIKHLPKYLQDLLVKEAEISGARGFIPIENVQIAGVSYKTIGEGGLKAIKYFTEKGDTVKVPTTLNPAGMDLEKWKEQGISENFAKKQLEIIDAFKKIGVVPTASCIPYSLGNFAPSGKHIAFGESSAVNFVNSVLGCRTNRENSIKTIVSALSGYTLNNGMHLPENRNPDCEIQVKCKLNSIADFGALGYFAGEHCEIPYFSGISPNFWELKAIAAASAAVGSVNLFFVEGMIPADRSKIQKIVPFGVKELEEVYRKLNTTEKIPDFITVGCPHYDIFEIKKIALLLQGKKLKIPFWIMTANLFKVQAKSYGYLELIEKSGACLYSDTCMVVAPIEDLGFNITATDSAKAAKYLPNFCRQSVVYKPLEKLIVLASE